ncbi:hypothetical protein B0H13DRAFT_2372747 [Mycena leptocephala]|nr:hypothetical protein B0H13DRAFT_2372747 [Mycena leptocephala]
MTSRPYHTIYEDCLLHLHHGRPVWKADPGSKEKLQVGDIGYYLQAALNLESQMCADSFSLRYGQVKQVDRLPLGEICGESHSIETQTIPFPRPVRKQIRRKVAYFAGAGAAPGVPVEFGGKASVKTEHLKTAALSLETRQALFSFLDHGDQARVESYAIKHYKQWLKDEKFHGVALADIVIVLGTYMTKNWIATASATESRELSGDVHVNVAHIANAHGGAASHESQGSTPGYNCGHLHAGVSEIAPSTDLEHFQKCGLAGCSPPLNQCVFIRTMRFREKIRLWGHALVEVIVQGESTVTKLKHAFPKDGSSTVPSESTPVSTSGTSVDAVDMEDMGSIDSDCEALYDAVAHGKFQANPGLEVVVVSDDEVIRHLGGDPDPTAMDSVSTKQVVFQANPGLEVVVVSDDEVIRHLGGDPDPTATDSVNPGLEVVVVSDDEVIRHLGGDPDPTATDSVRTKQVVADFAVNQYVEVRHNVNSPWILGLVLAVLTVAEKSFGFEYEIKYQAAGGRAATKVFPANSPNIRSTK